MSRLVVLRMTEDDAETFLADAREYPDSPLLTPVQEHDVEFTVESLREQVEALREERLQPRHRGGSWAELRQQGEVNALDAVLRLIDTGHWRQPRPGEVGYDLAADEARLREIVADVNGGR